MYKLKKSNGIYVVEKSLDINKDLAIDFNFKEYGAQRIRDSVSKSLGIFTNTPSWFRDKYGLGIDFDANTEYIKTEDLTQNQANRGQITAEIIGTRDTGGSGTNYGALVFKKNGTGDTGNRVWNIENDNADAGWGIGFQYWFSSQLGIWSIPYPSAGELFHWILRYNSASTGNDPTWWNNGKPLTVTERVTPSGTARTDGRYLYIGNNATAFTSGWDGKVYLVRVWNRMLSDGEVYDLYKDPNHIYRKAYVIGKAGGAVSVSVDADVVSITGSIPAPAITGGAGVSADVVSISSSLPAPTITGGAIVSSDVVSASFSVPDPTIMVNSIDVTADAEYATARFGVFDPIVKDTSVPIHKHYFYKIYDAGVYLTTWSQEVISLPSFRMNINGGAGELRVKLAREFDNFGEDEDVKLNNTVECYVADKENPNGLLLYSGYISGYKPVLDKADEHIDITLFSFVAQLQFLMLRDSGGATTLTYNSYDPSDILRDVIDKLRALGSSLSYTATSIQDTNTVVSYTFNTNTGKECIDKIVELCPEGWFWRVDPDNVIYLKPKNVLSDHAFILGKHIEKLETYRRIEDLVNTIFFTGGGSPKLFKKFENTSSQDTYGKHEKKIVDERVTDPDTASTMSTRVLNAQKDPEIRSNFEIVDSNGPGLHGYDIEAVKVGHTLKVLNLKSGQKTITLWDVGFWDIDVWDQTLATSAADVIQILSLMYEPDSIKIEASSRIPQIAKRVEDINRNVENSQTVDNPSAPS